MNDLNQLVLAAYAAGLTHVTYDNGYDGSNGIMLCDDIGRHTSSWDPINSGEDALWLASKLEIRIEWNRFDVAAVQHDYDVSEREPKGSSPYAAARRAIVKAAVEIALTIQELEGRT